MNCDLSARSCFLIAYLCLPQSWSKGKKSVFKLSDGYCSLRLSDDCIVVYIIKTNDVLDFVNGM